MINKVIAKQLKRPTGFLGKILSRFLKQMNSDIYAQVIKDVDAQDGDIIFEIGYGHGSGVLQLAKNANCVVDGIDFSKVMYDDAVKLNKSLIEQGRVHLTYGDFLEYDMQQNNYNKVFCVNVIYFWSDLVTPFTQIKNSLTKGGFFFIYMDSLEEIKNSRFTNEENFNSYTVENVNKQLLQVGLESTHYDFARGHIIKASN